MKIEDLADFPALQQVEGALWKQGKTRGAAVLVGAGFSRNADLMHEGSVRPPLWSDLASAMEQRLGNRLECARDPLRTAEEFRAMLGQPALEGLIRELVPDDQWAPGSLHKRLVALPWVDILTTNWDTLLERAAATTLGQTYETVRCLEDIATTRQPRVVKLHGSLPSNRPFILSEEDYRSYPQQFAPFVNLVQQVLLENELCLLGFSGDDPNFLKWSGWVRDQLGVSARRIYLIGVLKLRTAQRRLLEQRNVSPIDLSPLVEHLEPSQRHRAAAQMFLERLYSNRPKQSWEWNCERFVFPASFNPKADANHIAEALRGVATKWAAERSSYPGWAVCPPELRREIRANTEYALQNPYALALMSAPDRAKICFEAVWRLETALLPIGMWEATLAEAVSDIGSWNGTSQRDFVMTLLLRNAREDRNIASFKRWEIELEQRATSAPDVLAWLTYERCLLARDVLNFTELTKLIPTLNGNNDPLWALRRAALHSYLGNFDAARADVDQVIAETRDIYSRNRNSIWALSRLAWAHFCARPLRIWNEPYTASEEITSLKLRIHEMKCEPWDTISDLNREIEESIRRHEESSRTIEARFEPGTYYDHSKTIRFGSSTGLINYEMDRLADLIGIPLRTRNSSVLIQQVERGACLATHESDTDYLRLLRIIQADQPTALERTFGRIKVARLRPALIDFLTRVLSSALQYALDQLPKRDGWSDQFWSTRASIYIDILSRLLVRSEAAEALKWFHKGLAFGQDSRWHYPELFESLERVLPRTLSAIPLADRANLLAEVMEFPLPDEISLPQHVQRDWPNSSNWIAMSLMRRSKPDDGMRKRIESFIQMSRNGTLETRRRAVFWLMQLEISGVLNAQESKEFGNALWSRCDSGTGFPSDTSLRSHMFLLLPSPDGSRLRDLFKKLAQGGCSATYILSVAGATNPRPDGTRYELFEHSEALSSLRTILDWHPELPPTLDFGQVGVENENALRSVGTAIANGILPLLSPGDLPAELADRIFARENDTLSIVQAYPELARLIPSEEDRAIRGIIRAMVSRENNAAWAGFNALYRWLRAWQSKMLCTVPERLAEATVSIVETRREPGLIHALNIAGYLLESKLLSAGDMERVASALGLIYIETAYDTVESYQSADKHNLTLIREKAARLAGRLKANGVDSTDLDLWIENAPTDPMPEVRFALGTPFE